MTHLNSAYWKRIKELCDKATPGEWDFDSEDNVIYHLSEDPELLFEPCDEQNLIDIQNNAAFIAESRTALPRALDIIDKLAAALEGIVEEETGYCTPSITDSLAIAKTALKELDSEHI
jgi:hypothetical protein